MHEKEHVLIAKKSRNYSLDSDPVRRTKEIATVIKNYNKTIAGILSHAWLGIFSLLLTYFLNSYQLDL